MKRRGVRLESGFSLIETLAALVVFSIVTVGVVPLMLSSIRGGDVTRSFTIGKTLAQRAMEQVRGLPYYRAAGAPAQRLDVLDFYFPFGSNGGGANYAGGTYTTTCTPSTSGGISNPSCPLVLPAGYDLKYSSQFVTPAGTTPETYSVVAPAATYAWNSATTDLPPSQLLRMTITVAWTLGRPHSFALTSILGDRQVPTDKVRGVARVDYAVQVVGSYVDNVSGRTSNLVGIVGTAESRIETRLQAQADQTVSGGVMRLTEPAVEPTPAVILDSLSGAASNLRAPPDSPTAAGASAAADDIVHPDPLIGTIAHLDRSSTSGIGATSTLTATAENGLPVAEGEFTLNPLPHAAFDLWVNNRAETGENTTLLLSPNDLGTTPVFSVIPLGSNTTEGSSQAVTGDAASASRRVETIATVRVGQANLFPVVYRAGQPVIIIKDFSATTRCNSTASATTAVADASYSATLQYFAETDPDDGLPDGSLVTHSPGLSSANTSDPLATLAQTNPMVRELPADLAPEGHEKDIYLFPVTHLAGTTAPGHTAAHVAPHQHPGYIQSWDSKYAGTIFESTADAGRVTGARVDGAINITTVRSHPQRPETRLIISIGKLVCEAVDRR